MELNQAMEVLVTHLERNSSKLNLVMEEQVEDGTMLIEADTKALSSH